MNEEINSYEEEEEYIKIIQRQGSRIRDLEAKLDHKDYILDLWKQFVENEYQKGKTLDAYNKTLEEIEEGE